MYTFEYVMYIKVNLILKYCISTVFWCIYKSASGGIFVKICDIFNENFNTIYMHLPAYTVNSIKLIFISSLILLQATIYIYT